MYYFLSFISAFCIALMVFINGNLSEVFDVYSSVFIIHLIGSFCVWLWMRMKKISIAPVKKARWFWYTGGVVGLFTTIFMNATFGFISVSGFIALSLLGQTITSLFIDQFGFFSMEKSPITIRKTIGVSITLIGICIMFHDAFFTLPAIIMALFSGVTVVLSRTLDAGLAESTNEYSASWYHFISASIVALFIFLLRNSFSLNVFTTAQFSINEWWIFSGGILGVIIVVLSNLCVMKISAINMTLIIFAGQIFTGLIIDMAMSGSFNIHACAGGLFSLCGLLVNILNPKKQDYCTA